ncbi:MAG: XRE family transcriptional regulator [Clostridia bacterium]|nr:MAG: XRE family transcriptional regulator [Clostridia bacterium]
MTFGEKLQKLRKVKGWTQEELAQKITVSRQALSKWELGAAIPDTENVLQISKLFGVSTDYLLNDEYESDSDIPAVKVESSILTQKYTGKIHAIIGGIISVISAVGLLIIGILSSKAVVNYPETEKYTTSKHGLEALFELYNIEWLFVLCIILFFIGLLIAFYPKLRSHRTKKKTDVY